MSQNLQGRVIHPSVAATLTVEEIKAFFDVRELLADPKFAGSFDMEKVSDCGTPLCMAGHISARLGYNTDKERQLWFMIKVGTNSALRYLFSPGNPSDRVEAVRALDHYLETGAGNWPCVSELDDLFVEVMERRGK